MIMRIKGESSLIVVKIMAKIFNGLNMKCTEHVFDRSDANVTIERTGF